MHHSNATNDDHGLVSTASPASTTAPNLSLLRQLRPPASSSSSSIPLHHLPLRPGTATLLYACGYRYTHDVVEDIPTLARELRPFRGTGSTKQNESRTSSSSSTSTTGSTSSSSISNHLEYARRIYQEVVDAVAIVLGTTTTATTNNNNNGNSNNSSSSVPMTPMAMTTTMSSSTVQTAADLLRRPNGVGIVGGGPPLSTTSIQPHRHHHQNNSNNNSNSITSIITFCRALDDLLGGGIAVGELTELAGPPGSGKTTLTMQLAVNAALPEYCGGVHGRTVLIDTEGSFSPERCHDLATHLIQHVQTGLKRKHRQSVLHNNNSHHHPNITTPPPPQEWNVTASQILDNILVYRAHDVADLTAIVGALPALLEEETTKDVLPIRLVLIDSLAFPYRAVAAPTDAWGPTTTTTTTIMDYATRTQHLTTLAATLTSYAVQYQCAVVAVNQMTTKFVLPNNNTNTNNNNHDEAVMRWRPDSENDPHHSNVVTPGEKGRRTQLIPALGESWAHAVTSRLILLQRHNSSLSLSNDDENNDTTNPPAALQYRTCALTKSPRLPAGEASLVITPVGIRGMEYIEAQNKKKKKRRTSTSNPSME